MSSSGLTVSEWLDQVREGDAEALRQLWNRYFQKLAQMAGRRISSLATRAADGEDVAASVFESLWDGAQLGRFDNVQDRHELWWLLVAMTRRKSISHIRRESAVKRGGDAPRISLSLQPGSSKEFEEVLSRDPAPADVAALDEELDRLLAALRDQNSRRIAVLLLQGHSPEDISRDVGLALATVRRKIRLIRAVWREEYRP
jgi:DNA-directed RNA polymerase specialized sigma24 family protein